MSPYLHVVDVTKPVEAWEILLFYHIATFLGHIFTLEGFPTRAELLSVFVEHDLGYV